MMPRLEQIKAGKMAQAVQAPVRPHAVKVDTGNMPSVNWQQYQPAASVQQQEVPANYFVTNPTVNHAIDQRAHDPPPVPVDPDDPFAASIAFSGAPIPPNSSCTASATLSSAFPQALLLRQDMLILHTGSCQHVHDHRLLTVQTCGCR